MVTWFGIIHDHVIDTLLLNANNTVKVADFVELSLFVLEFLPNLLAVLFSLSSFYISYFNCFPCDSFPIMFSLSYILVSYTFLVNLSSVVLYT